ncbi:hypothetical protein CEXT_79831 [Caerostris extrusa]|uniref:Uncharacterized protein n=1 Tax=Caerostris extrusa TaxID=172846 RepID=A0AAV4REQ1_CAEEX|nr:hypothetical protein CEXT_79831 [Caerostris extrusa]
MAGDWVDTRPLNTGLSREQWIWYCVDAVCMETSIDITPFDPPLLGFSGGFGPEIGALNLAFNEKDKGPGLHLSL